VSVLLEREGRGAREVPELLIARLAERISSASAREPLEQWITLRDLLNRVTGRRWVSGIRRVSIDLRHLQVEFTE